MKDESIVKPQPVKEFSREKVLYIPVDTRSRSIKKGFCKLALKEKPTPFGDLILLKNKTLLYQCLGAPLAVMMLERLIVSGTKEILILGFAGSINPQIQIHDVASITLAHSEEGTSRHYFPEKTAFHSSPRLREKIEESLLSLSLPFRPSTIVSTDAPFRETHSWKLHNREKGVDLVDMETSAVFALAQFYGIHAAALMIVSDELVSKDWKTGFRDSLTDTKIKEYFFPLIYDE